MDKLDYGEDGDELIIYTIKNYLERSAKNNMPRKIKSCAPVFFGQLYILTKIIAHSLFGKMIEFLYDTKLYHNSILFMSYPINWKDNTNPLLQDKKTDLMIGDVLRNVKDHKFTPIALSHDASFFIDFNTMFGKILHTKGLWKPIETYLTIDMIKKSLNFIKSIQYDNSARVGFFKHNINKIFKYDAFNTIIYIELVKRAIEATKPKAIVVTCEYCMFGRAAVIAGHIKGVPTLAIQHGIIIQKDPDYIFNKEDKDKIVLPDITCVCGQYHYDLLTKDSIYEPEQVIVTGQPRYDLLYHMDKIYSKKRFLEKHGINPKHKIILWTTQSHVLSDDENTKNLVAMFEAMHKLTNTTLIIKQHPAERKKDTKKIRQYLTDYIVNAVMMPKSLNIYEQIFVCDLMVTRHSATGMEAVVLDKPVIVLNLDDGIDYAGYEKEGVARGVYKKGDLTIAIKELLQDDSYLAQNRDTYIEKYLYKIDGKASERVVNIIENMI